MQRNLLNFIDKLIHLYYTCNMKTTTINFRLLQVEKSLIIREAKRRKISVSKLINILWQDFKSYRDLWFRHKNYARTIFNLKLKSGAIEKMDCCICGNKNTEAHHIDYSSPTNVTWLCRKCHKNAHKNNENEFGIK